ncbi:hypothetical protein [Streptomyces galilaeus]|nr:hypothetical protein [Streptomyces galilaeus]
MSVLDLVVPQLAPMRGPVAEARRRRAPAVAAEERALAPPSASSWSCA